LNYFEFLKADLTCAHCQWQGKGTDASVVEAFDSLAEYACPRCDEKIAVVSYPTFAESRANWQNLGEADRLAIEIAETRNQEFAARCLRTPDQLPNIDLPAFTLVWDFDETQNRAGDTVIRLGDRVIWREPSVYEGSWRFAEVAKILQSRYGASLQDLEPTTESLLNLYGDKLGAPHAVDVIRDELRKTGQPLLAKGK
jgi:hypothetical protein